MGWDYRISMHSPTIADAPSETCDLEFKPVPTQRWEDPPKHAMITFLKLGGSLLTDKTQDKTIRPDIVSRISREIAEYVERPNRRPLLLVAPADSDPRLVETMRRIEASRCDFVDRDVVLGRIVTEGTSTLDGHVVDTNQARRLRSEFGIGADSFSVVLIGKDGGEKLRIADVPDLQAIYAVIDGMPMRARETSTNPKVC